MEFNVNPAEQRDDFLNPLDVFYATDKLGTKHRYVFLGYYRGYSSFGDYVLLNIDNSSVVYETVVEAAWLPERTVEKLFSVKENIYDTMVQNGVPETDIDHHASDLYLRKTRQVIDLYDAYKAVEMFENISQNSRGHAELFPLKIAAPAETFRATLGGGTWLDIPFAYKPFWDKKN